MSGLTLERLIHDPSDSADSANVGAYLRSSDGTHLTHTTVAAKEALDINIAASDIDIQVDLDLSSLTAHDAVYNENGVPGAHYAHDTASALGAVSADGDKTRSTADLYGRQFVMDAPNVSVANAAVTIGAVESQIKSGASNLAGRSRMFYQNTSNNDLFVGATGVTTATGIKISKGSTLALEIGEAVNLFAIAAGAGNDSRVLELA